MKEPTSVFVVFFLLTVVTETSGWGPLKRLLSKVPKPDLFGLVGSLQWTSQKLVNFRRSIVFDCSAGAFAISTPDDHDYLPVIEQKNETEVTPILWAHQTGRKLIRKAPDNALLGLLVLIGSELIRREVDYKADVVPNLVRDIANTTVYELDSKLELLSSLQWNFDPFLKSERENLQTQPIEAIDKYIVTEILPRVQKDISPMLENMVQDPEKVREVTSNIKKVIELGTLSENLLAMVPSTPKTTSSIIEQVDLVGKGIEEAVHDWNRVVSYLKDLVGSDAGVISKMQNPPQLKTLAKFGWYNSSTNAATGLGWNLSKLNLSNAITGSTLNDFNVTFTWPVATDSPLGPTNDENKGAQQRFLWSSSQPFSLYSTIERMGASNGITRTPGSKESKNSPAGRYIPYKRTGIARRGIISNIDKTNASSPALNGWGTMTNRNRFAGKAFSVPKDSVLTKRPFASARSRSDGSESAAAVTSSSSPPSTAEYDIRPVLGDFHLNVSSSKAFFDSLGDLHERLVAFEASMKKTEVGAGDNTRDADSPAAELRSVPHATGGERSTSSKAPDHAPGDDGSSIAEKRGTESFPSSPDVGRR